MQKIYRKTLIVMYQSHESYENLLNLDDSVSLHQKHLRLMVTEIFQSVSKTDPDVVIRSHILVLKTYRIV